MHIPSLFIASSDGRGNGVFTGEDLHANDIIEICPILIIPKEDVAQVHQTILHDYYFLHPNIDGAAYIGLGYGSMYNHNSKPNAEVVFDAATDQMQIHCLKNIFAGEEIFIDYNGGSKEGVDIWFKET